MFRKAFNSVRRWLYRMGWIKGIKNLENHKDIMISEEMYAYIDMWRSLYRGYLEQDNDGVLWHKHIYKTLDGVKERRLDTLNMPKISAGEMASLVYNEKCEISIGDNDNETAKFIEDVLKENKFNKKFQDYLEYSFAIGGMVIKPYVENEQIKLSFVTADCFVPISWSNETITEAVFVNEIQKGNKKYTHLEWHEWKNGKDKNGKPIKEYVITNELYESNNSAELGVKVPLSTLPQYANIDEKVPVKNLTRPLFAYFKPNTANNIDTQSPLGISIFANAMDTLKAIDVAFDSFNREFRLGKKRIIVPAHMIKTVVDPETGNAYRYFDSNDETYEAFNSAEMDNEKIQEMNITLRVDEHVNAINALLNLYAMQTGFSSGTFTFDGQSMKTATEVISEQSKTFKSKKSHEIIIESALQELIHTIIELADLYGIHSATKDYEIKVSFDDSIVEDDNSEIEKESKKVINKMTSRRRAIMKIEGCTEEEAMEIIKEIVEEERMMEGTNPEEIDSVIFGARE